VLSESIITFSKNVFKKPTRTIFFPGVFNQKRICSLYSFTYTILKRNVAIKGVAQTSEISLKVYSLRN